MRTTAAMRLGDHYRPDAVFEALGPEFGDPVEPARFANHILRWRNDRAAAMAGLNLGDDAAWIEAFAQFSGLPDNMRRPLAMRYHGHQFRQYNPDIGDGRGFLYAQLRDRHGRLLDLGTKGSGQTPYSRFGDGRLTLKGGVREVLAAEMLEAQGVKTSKALSLVETGEALTRGDEPSPTRSSVLVRLQHSHIRFGTFQRLAFIERPDLMTQMVDHAITTYYPHLASLEGQARVAGLLGDVIAASGSLVGGWMSAGFVHGVLNTDNLVVTGESFDYGPWRFLPASIPGFTAAYFDEQGLYCFARQPQAVAWALAQLATALCVLADPDLLYAELGKFPAAYQHGLRDKAFARLGLETGDVRVDLTDLSNLFTWMTESEAPWDQFFHDWFCGEASADRAAQSPKAALYDTAAFKAVRAQMFARAPARPERLAHDYFKQPKPASLVIGEVENLWDPIVEHDDWSAFRDKITEIRTLGQALDIAVA